MPRSAPRRRPPPRRRLTRQPRRRHKPQTAAGTSRDNPVEATFISRALLNKQGSAKETWHIEFDLTECGLDYQVGDAFGLYPHNDPALADAVLKALDAPPDFPIGGRTLARGADRRRFARARARHAVPAVLLHHRRRAAEEGAGAVGRRGPGRRRRDARRAGGDREILRRAARSRGLHRGARSAAAAALFDLVVAEGAQGPRRAHRRCGALRRSASASGSASPRPSSPGASSRAPSSASMCRRRTPSACRPIPNVPIIMVGPGTGVAPFRAFLHERMATKAPGRNWLFFGHQQARLRFLLRGRVLRHEGRRRADAAVARLVARRR